MGFLNRHFVIAAQKSPMPWQNLCVKQLSSCPLPGIQMDLIQNLADSMNFTFSMEHVDSLDTVSQYFANSRADFGMDFVEMDEQVKTKGLILSAPFTHADYGFMYRRDQPDPKVLYMLRLPFSWLVWGLIALSVVVFSVVTAGLWQHPTSFVQGAKGLKRKILSGTEAFMRSFWMVAMLALQQGLPDSYFFHKRPFAQRSMFAVWLFTTFVMAASFGSKLIGILLDMKEEVIPFDTIQGLTVQMEENGYRLIVLSSEVENFGKRIELLKKKPEFKRYGDMVRKYPLKITTSYANLVDELMKDPYLVYPAHLTKAEYHISDEDRCKLRIIPSWEEAVPISLPLSPSFTLRHEESFNRGLLTLSTTFYDQIRAKYIPKTRCGKHMKYQDMGLGIYDLQAGLWLFVGGVLVFSCPYLVVEFIFSRAKTFYTEHVRSVSRFAPPSEVSKRRHFVPKLSDEKALTDDRKKSGQAFVRQFHNSNVSPRGSNANTLGAPQQDENMLIEELN